MSKQVATPSACHCCVHSVCQYECMPAQYTNTPSYSGFMCRLYFNKSQFTNIKTVSRSIHESQSSFFMDTPFTVSKWLPSGGNPSSEVSYQEVIRIRKGVPKCKKWFNQFRSAIEYYLCSINTKAMEEYKFVTPFVCTYKKSNNIRIPTMNDYHNEKFISLLNQLLGKKPQISECTSRFYISEIEVNNDTTLTANIHWPEAYLFKHIVDQQLIDFLVYLCSCYVP